MLARASLASVVAVVLTAASCTSFAPLAQGTCGNGAVDSATEDCDTVGAGGTTSCRPSGATGQCRFDCTGTHTCPAGFGCGLDGVCRSGSSTFKFASSFPAPQVVGVQLSDFDGDGRQDVVTDSANDVRVSYFDTTLTLASQFTIPVPNAVPTVGHLTTDKTLADLVIDDRGSVDVWRGHSERTLAPTVYPAFPVPGTLGGRVILIDALPGTPGSTLLFLADAGIVEATSEHGNPPVMFLQPAPVSALAGDIVIAHFVDDPTLAPCDTFALAYTTEAKVHLYTPCRVEPLKGLVINSPGPLQQLLADVLLPAGANVTGVLAARINEDAHVDLLIAAGSSIFVAYGVGDGSFHSMPTVPAKKGDGNAAPFTLVVTNDPNGTVSGFPLASGDLDGDGLSDFVMTSAILFADKGSAAPSFTAALGAPQEWSLATIADLNANGIPDVVAIAGTAINFYNGAGGRLFNPMSYSTAGSISSLATGDIDGDLVNDLVLAQGATDDTGASIPGDELTLQFGRPSGGYPEEPLVIGTLPKIDQIAVAPLTAALVNPNASTDDIADIAVVSEDSTNPQNPVLIAALQGRADRELTSPFSLVDSALPTERALASARLATGSFTSASHQDIASIAFDPPTRATGKLGPARLWLAPMTGDADVSSASIRASTPFTDAAVDYLGARILGVDLDDPSAGGIDELIGVIQPSALGTVGELFIAKATAGAFAVTKTTPLGASAPTFFPWIVKQHDLNADGTADVVALYGDNVAGVLARRITVFWNEKTGDLGPSASADVPPLGGDTPLTFALINVDSDPETEIVITSATTTYLAKLDPTGRSFLPVTVIASIKGGANVVGAGDVDGDGVPDLVSGAGDVLHVFHGVPRLP